MEQIKLQQNIGVSGKRLLLEAAIRTPEVALHPNPVNMQAYHSLADKLVIHSPVLQKLAGIMKSILGLILYPLSLGHTKEWITAGIATYKAGVDSERRKEIQHTMKDQLHHLKDVEFVNSVKTDTQSTSLV
ncbi:hypothetical protein [Legionella brunensis]|uniref:Uncharacterized protein n=1 Tax=Legionella brunensis TaxID=29422 RepID=A0A0W0STC1_9GAMM|nr:hypothetical protein [Legionella brunensis]KTC86592.1 hypothetical protein Lbru_0533 [Legionella brunensis]